MVFDRIPAVESRWRELEATGHCFVFQTYDWLATWQRTVGDATGVEPCIVWIGAGADGHGLMLLPFGIERRAGCRVLVWLGAPLADYRGPILAPGSDLLLRDFGRTLWPKIMERLPSIDYLQLTLQTASIDGQANPFLELSHHELPYRAHATDIQGDWESYYRSKRSSKSRNTERRKEKKLGALGRLSFEIATTPADISPMLEALFAQKSERLATQGAADLFAVPGMPAFIRDLTLADSGQGRIQLAALKLDDQIIAVHWGAVYRKRFYFLLPALDAAQHARLSPGSLLIRRLFEWAFSEKLSSFDFTIGDEAYKAHWCERQMPIYETLIARSALGQVVVSLLKMSAYGRRLVRSQPRLYALATTLRNLRKDRRWPDRQQTRNS